MVTSVKTRIVKIGNSQGVRIPKAILEQAGLEEQGEVELEVGERQIVIRPAGHPRAGWRGQFEEMARQGDDRLLDLDLASLSEWDDSEWEW